MSISDQHGRRVFALEIAGCTTRYYSHEAPTGSNLDTDIAVSIPYVDYQAISSISAYSADLDPAGGIANYGALTISLNVDSRRGSLNDPHVVLGRCGPRSTDILTAQITEDLPRDTTMTLDVDQDLTSLTYPRLMHIGAESIYILHATATTLNVWSRAVGNTPNQAHIRTLGGTNVPEVSSEIMTFRGRRAILYGARQRPDGSVSDYVQILNGIIEASPKIESGESISISLVPLTALIDNEVSQKDFVGNLKQGYHYFDGTNASAIEYAELINPKSYQVPYGELNLPSASTFHLIGERITEQFDVTLSDGGDDNDGGPHPRYPKIRNRTTTIYPTSLTYAAGTDQTEVVINGTLSTGWAGSGYLNFLPRDFTRDAQAEIKIIPLVSNISDGVGELKTWPDCINEKLIAHGPTVHTGISGGVLSWRISTGETDQIIVTNLTPIDQSPNALIFFSSSRRLEQYKTRDTPALYDETSYDWFRWTGEGSFPVGLDAFRLSYPIDLWDEDFPAVPEELPDGSESGPQAIRSFASPIGAVATQAGHQINAIATAFYQYQETQLLVESSMGLPSSATSGTRYPIEVHYIDRSSDEERKGYLSATHETQALDGATLIGYYIHLDYQSDNISFGDWPGQERVRLVRAARFVNESPGELLLKLFESGGGELVNGAYDVLTIGLNIPSSHIDESSFLNYSAQGQVFSGSLSADGVSLREVIEPILQSMGAAIIMKRDSVTGVSKVALVPLAFDRKRSAVIEIEEGDWLTDPPPTWDTYEDIITQIEIKYNYDNQEEKFLGSAVYNNQEAINRYDGEKRKISLDLYGVSSDQFGSGTGDPYNHFLPMVARLFQILSNPLRVWRGSIGTGPSIYLDLGSYAVVNSPLLKGYGVDYGVTDGVGMIRSIRQELMGEGCQLEIISTGLEAVAWNASANVINVPNVQQVEVSASHFGANDISAFSKSDVVDFLPVYNEDSAITGLVISAITGQTITFTAPHGITTLGTIESTTYASAVGDLKLDGYLASTASPPLINSTKAQVYS